MPQPAPLLSSLLEIEPAWIDHNDHLNMGYYTVLFDRAADEVFAQLGFGPAYRAAHNHTTFSAEFHIRYLRELRLGDRVRASFGFSTMTRNGSTAFRNFSTRMAGSRRRARA